VDKKHGFFILTPFTIIKFINIAKTKNNYKDKQPPRGFLRGFSKCFTDYRKQEAIEHTAED
jgi:hypothetical protein